mmetsp:Transcript_5218/g.13540  ORF Transcript_5218/g.13540 Transcript_5218/m.13540 type:complete len:282 (-) Transcript_5218:590-1435(-)
MGHFSFSTIITWLKERFWHPALSTLARTHVTGCESCTRFNMKRSHYRFDGARRQSNVTRVIAVDFAGPFPKDGKVRYVIVAVEVVTGYPFAKAVTTATAHEAAEFLINEVFSFVGIPSVFLSDHGTHFDNHLIAALASTYNFTHRFSPPTTSQVNGQAERTIQSIQNILYKTVYQFERPGRAWAYLIPQALFAMRIKPNSRTRSLPSIFCSEWNRDSHQTRSTGRKKHPWTTPRFEIWILSKCAVSDTFFSLNLLTARKSKSARLNPAIASLFWMPESSKE